jgi:hypothetical protein
MTREITAIAFGVPVAAVAIALCMLYGLADSPTTVIGMAAFLPVYWSTHFIMRMRSRPQKQEDEL